MTLRYPSGEEIRLGDVVTYDGQSGHVELVVSEATGDPASDWHLETNGPGILIREPKVFGRVYVSQDHFDDGLLKFVLRREPA